MTYATIEIMAPQIEGYYTVKEAAGELGIKPVTVRAHISRGNIKAIKIAGSWLIPGEELEKIRDIKPGPKPNRGG